MDGGAKPLAGFRREHDGRVDRRGRPGDQLDFRVRMPSRPEVFDGEPDRELRPRVMGTQDRHRAVERLRDDVPGLGGGLRLDFSGEPEGLRQGGLIDAGGRRLADEQHRQELDGDSLSGVPGLPKQERADAIMELQQGISAELNQEKIGKTFKVLFDRKEGGYFIGRTEYDSPEVDNEVLVPASQYVRLGDFAQVKVTSAEEFDLYGEVIS